MLINVKMPTIVGILIFMSRISFMLMKRVYVTSDTEQLNNEPFVNFCHDDFVCEAEKALVSLRKYALVSGSSLLTFVISTMYI